jgi:membrane-bound lytic murein transglycosylase D
LFPTGAVLILPSFSATDFLNNEQANYLFIEAVDAKEILINEERIVYSVIDGDYLGRIAREFGVKVFELKKWNNLLNSRLDIGEKLVIYSKIPPPKTNTTFNINKNKYIVQPGDTLWDIAQKHNGLSVRKIKSLNNLESDNINPGTIILLPIS